MKKPAAEKKIIPKEDSVKSSAPIAPDRTTKKLAPIIPQPANDGYLEAVASKKDDTYGFEVPENKLNEDPKDARKTLPNIPNLPKTLPKIMIVPPALPQTKPKVLAPSQQADNSYLQPVANKKDDTYGSATSDNSYLEPVKNSNDNTAVKNKINSFKDFNTKFAPKSPPTFIPNISITDETDASGYLLPSQGSPFVSQTVGDLKPIDHDPNETNDDESGDRYLLPRHGSTISSASQISNNSVSSTTPLKFLKSDKPKLMPRRYNNKKNENLQNNNGKGTKANIPPNIQETDI
jgi:hypothetical protein